MQMFLFKLAQTQRTKPKPLLVGSLILLESKALIEAYSGSIRLVDSEVNRSLSVRLGDFWLILKCFVTWGMIEPLLDEQRIHSLQAHYTTTADQLRLTQAKLCSVEEIQRLIEHEMSKEKPSLNRIHTHVRNSVGAMTKLEQELSATKEKLVVEFRELGVEPIR